MDGCTELRAGKWGREALKPGGSPLEPTSWSRVGHPMLMWDLEWLSWAALEAAAQAEAHIPGV